MAVRGWHERSQESKARILAQLRRMVAELRSVSLPEATVISSVDGGPFYDCRLAFPHLRGPYQTTRDFHEALANGGNIDFKYANLADEVSEIFAFYLQCGNELVLTHGDMSSLNIMVNEDEVTGIVDWETAGWFPRYWEYTYARQANPRNFFWADEVDGFLAPCLMS